MKKYLPLLSTVMGFTILVAGCTTIEDLELQSLSDDIEPSMDTRSGLNYDAENPYSLSKVQTAYNILANEKGWETIELEPTDLYVRFLPVDSLHYYILLDSLELELFDHPLDRILTTAQMEAFAVDSVAGGIWQYTTVPVSFDFPSEMQYEILDDIYIQPNDIKTIITNIPDFQHTATVVDSLAVIAPMKLSRSQMTSAVWDTVIEKSLEITGNGSAPEATRAGTWYPSATVMFLSDYPGVTQAMPLEGVKVRVNHFVNYGNAITDVNGETGNIRKNNGDKFRRDVNYKIIWDNKRWNIRNGRTGQAKTNGPDNSYSHWSITISGTSKDAMFAAAHKALYNYVYKTFLLTEGLTISGINKLNTGVIDECHKDATTGRFNGVNPWFGGNAVKLWVKKSDGTRRNNWEVESTMYHELGHASHWRAARIDKDASRWDMIDNNLREPFANTVEYVYMRSIYPDFEGIYNQRPSTYHGIGEWLICNGFSIAQIEYCVMGGSYGSWRNRAKEFNIIPDHVVDVLFDDPWTEWRINFNELINASDRYYAGDITLRTDPVLNSLDSLTYVDWVLPNGVTALHMDSDSLIVNILNAGDYEFGYTVTLPSGIDHTCTKTISIIPGPTIRGPEQVSIGSTATFTLDNYIGEADSWRVAFLDENGATSAVARKCEIRNTHNAYELILFEPGTYIITVHNKKEENTEPGDPSSGSSSSSRNMYEDIAIHSLVVLESKNIERFYSYKRIDHPYDTWLTHQIEGLTSVDGTRTLTGGRSTGGSSRVPISYYSSDYLTSFYVFRELPSLTNINRIYLAPIYENWYYHSSSTSYAYAYDRSIYTDIEGNTSENTPIKFYIYTSQRPGTIPLYQIEESRYVNANMEWKIRYVTVEDKISVKDVTRWYWGGLFNTVKVGDRDWTETKNYGILGYVYPA